MQDELFTMTPVRIFELSLTMQVELDARRSRRTAAILTDPYSSHVESIKPSAAEELGNP